MMYEGQVEMDALRILRKIRAGMPWLPQIPSDEELLERTSIEVIDNDKDCIENGYSL